MKTTTRAIAFCAALIVLANSTIFAQDYEPKYIGVASKPSARNATALRQLHQRPRRTTIAARDFIGTITKKLRHASTKSQYTFTAT